MARNPGSTSNGGSFDAITVEAVWQKGIPVPGYPTFRRDACGALMQRAIMARAAPGRSIIRFRWRKAALIT